MKKEFFKKFNTRWRLNKLSKSLLKNKIVLDVNCDESNYTWILKKYGAKKIYCIFKEKKPRFINNGFHCLKSDFLKYNFRNKKFDFIFYNGALSHSKNYKKELKKLSYLCRSGGKLWLSVFGKGKHWAYSNRILKKMGTKEKKDFSKALLLRDWDHNKIKFLVDLFFTKKIFFSKKEIKKILNKNQFKNIRFLERGIKTDLNEKIFNRPNLKKIYGDGEIRLLAQKV